MSRSVNPGPILGYHIQDCVKVIDDGPVDRNWATRRLDQCIAVNRQGPCGVEQSVFGLFRKGDLNAFEPYILSGKAAEVVWDYKFGPTRFLLFEQISYNRRTIDDFGALYLMLDFYCSNQFDELQRMIDRYPKPSDFRSSFKS